MIVDLIQVLLSIRKVITTFCLLEEHPQHLQIAPSILALYKGFKARVAKAVSGLSVGSNSMQLQHSTGGDTNTGFMRDDLTSSPSVDISSATLTQNNAGTFRYVSGIPYYNSGSPTLTLAGRN